MAALAVSAGTIVAGGSGATARMAAPTAGSQALGHTASGHTASEHAASERAASQHTASEHTASQHTTSEKTAGGRTARTRETGERGAVPRARSPHELGYARWPKPYGRYVASRAVGQLSVYSQAERGRFPCTASVVASSSRSLVLTAAHCVREIGPKGDFYSRMRFMPAYSSKVNAHTGRTYAGEAPFGVWNVRRAWVAQAWRQSHADLRVPKPPNRFSKDDVAIVSVAPDRRGRRIQDVVGGFRPVSWDGRRVTGFTTLGYPYANETGLFGNLLYRCDGRAMAAAPRIAPQAVFTGDCWVRIGHSGGPWLTGSNSRPSVFAVTSATMTRPGSLAAPLRSDTFWTIYSRADKWSLRGR